MKDLDKFYQNLNEEMESEAKKRDLVFQFPEKSKRKSKLPYLAVAAALILIIPITTKLTYTEIQMRKLLREENGYFIDTMINEQLFSFDYQAESIAESDWFDNSKSLFN